MNNLLVYVINLDERKDRLQHTLDQFKDKLEFDCNIISTKRKKKPTLGLWNNLLKIVKKAKSLGIPFVIFCEDDHLFTNSYRYKNLLKAIKDVDQYEADLLLGGVSWFNNALQISEQVFWVCEFTGLQFTVIYKRFYDTILNTEFGPLDVADIKLSKLTNKKFVIHPFISTQKEFGYSDITTKNNKTGHVKQLFRSSSITFSRLKKVRRFYNKIEKDWLAPIDTDFSDISIPTYIINFQDDTEALAQIKTQFIHKPEFDIKIIAGYRDNMGKPSIWKNLRNIVQEAIDNEDDVIIISKDYNKFSQHYNRDTLIKNIIRANEMGVEILLANAVNLEQILPIGEQCYWFNTVEDSTFYIIYKGLFEKILSFNLREDDKALKIISMLSSHKMLLYPFITENTNHTLANLKGDETRLNEMRVAMSKLNDLNSFRKL